MKSSLRTHLPNLLFGGGAAGLFCALSRQVFAGDPSMFSIDRLVMALLLPGVIYLCAFGALHVGMLVLKRSTRWAYIAGGAVAMLLAFGLTTAADVVPVAEQSGIVSVVLALAALFGATLGYVYYRRAGIRAPDEDSDVVASAASSATPAAIAGAPGPEAAHVKAGSNEYFSGPLQVRTSVLVILLSGVGAGLAWTVISLLFLLLIVVGTMGPLEMAKAWSHGLGGFSAMYGFANVVVGVVLMPIPVFVGHLICRGRGWTSFNAYAGVGLVLGLLVGVVSMNFMLALPCVAGLTFYRYLAGLEPKALPEDIEVRDRRTLIGADHARRRYNRIVGG